MPAIENDFCGHTIFEAESPKSPTIHKKSGQKHFDAIVERHACRENEKSNGLPAGEQLAAFHIPTRYVEREHEYKHRHDEMVGDTYGKHHEGKRIGQSP